MRRETFLLEFAIPLNPVTKKNSNVRTKNGGMISSKAYRQYEKDAVKLIPAWAKAGINCRVNVKAVYYTKIDYFAPERKAKIDISNLHNALHDTLVAAANEINHLIAETNGQAEMIKQLKKELATEKRRADAAVGDMKRIVDSVREEHCDETCCFACKYDCDMSITDSGAYANECPGFERDDCFEWRGPQEAGNTKGEAE